MTLPDWQLRQSFSRRQHAGGAPTPHTNTGEQMIILVDEYGGIAGFLTSKEMLKEIVGPMSELGEDAGH